MEMFFVFLFFFLHSVIELFSINNVAFAPALPAEITLLYVCSKEQFLLEISHTFFQVERACAE